MTFTLRNCTLEITRSHLYVKALGWEALLDFTGQVGSSLNRT